MNTVDINLQIFSIILTLISILVAMVVGIITYYTYKLKIGQKAKASCVFTFSNDLPYISSVIIENLKDKDLVIHDIYVKFAPNIYIDLLDKDFEDKYNIVIPPLSVKEFKFGPAFMYNVNTQKVNIDKLFNTTKYKIVLSTSHGKLTCDKWGKGWNAISDSLTNHHVFVVRPIRIYSTSSVYFKENFENPAIDFSSYSKELKYLVKLIKRDGKLMYCPIYDNNKKIQLFKGLTFNNEVLKDEDSIREYLNKSKDKKIVDIAKIEEIYNIQKMMDSCLKLYTEESIELISENPWHFYTIGYISSKWLDIKSWWENNL